MRWYVLAGLTSRWEESCHETLLAAVSRAVVVVVVIGIVMLEQATAGSL